MLIVYVCLFVCLCMYMCVCIYIYIYIYVYIHLSLSLSLYIYIYTHIIYTYLQRAPRPATDISWSSYAKRRSLVLRIAPDRFRKVDTTIVAKQRYHRSQNATIVAKQRYHRSQTLLWHLPVCLLAGMLACLLACLHVCWRGLVAPRLGTNRKWCPLVFAPKSNHVCIVTSERYVLQQMLKQKRQKQQKNDSCASGLGSRSLVGGAWPASGSRKAWARGGLGGGQRVLDGTTCLTLLVYRAAPDVPLP